MPDVQAEALDAGTAFFMLAPDLRRFDRLIIVDAVRAGGAPGSVYRFLPEDVETRDAGISLHDMGVMEALRLERLAGGATGNVVLYGIEPLRVEPGIGLSGPVGSAIDTAAGKILEELLQPSSV
jgi:hydrogenase maturation protease